MHPVPRCSLPLLLLATLSAGEALPPPTLEEAALLGLTNAHRSQRWQYDPLIVKLTPKNMPDGTSVQGYCKSYFKPQPPLVHSPQLAAAARALLAAGTVMKEDSLPDAAAARFGYPASAATAATIVRGAASIEAAYANSLVYWVGSNSGRKVISFQTVLTTTWQEVGIAVARGAKGLDAVAVYGKGGPRTAGGVVYADANRDLAYDAAEGVAGVTVTCGAASMTTGPGGVWWLGVPEAAGTVTFASAGMQAVRPVAAGKDAAVIAWRVPPAEELKQLDAAITAAKSAAAARKPDSEDWPAAMIDLHLRTLLLDLDSARQEQIAALIQPLADEFDSMRRKYLSDLDGDAKAFGQRLAKDRGHYPGTQAARWFKELQTMAALRQQVVAACLPTAAGKTGPALWDELAKAKTASCDPVFRRQYENWLEQLGPAPAAPAGKPPKR